MADFDESKQARFVHAISMMLRAQKACAGSKATIEDADGNINQQAIGYIYGYVDATLQTIGQDMGDKAVGVPITYLILAQLFPDKADNYMMFLLNHVGWDAAVREGVMTGGSQYIEFNKPNSRGHAMGFARYLIKYRAATEGAKELQVQPPVQPTKDEHREAVLAQCDLAMVRDEIINFHQIAKTEAAKTGDEVVFKTEYVDAWYAFRDGPTIATAQALLAVAPQLSEYFARCSPDHEFYELTRFLKEHGVLTTR
jgi:hypothetical protein